MKKMNKIVGMLCMTALLAVFASSCKKDNTNAMSSFDCTLPAIEGESGLEDSRAYVDMVANKIKWAKGDQVMVYTFDEDYTNSQSAVFSDANLTTGATVAHFSGTALEEGSYGYFVFYPADKAGTEISEGNRVTFTVEELQEAGDVDLFEGTNYAGRIFMDPQGVVAASTCDANANGTLKHIFGFANVRIKDTGNSGKAVKSVAIMDSQMHLTGSISLEIPMLTDDILNGMKALGVNYKANGNAETYASVLNEYLHTIGYVSTPSGNEVKLATPDVQINSAYKFFLMPLRPGALMKGFTVTLTYSDDTSEEFIVPADKKYITIPGYYTNISIDLANGVL